MLIYPDRDFYSCKYYGRLCKGIPNKKALSVSCSCIEKKWEKSNFWKDLSGHSAFNVPFLKRHHFEIQIHGFFELELILKYWKYFITEVDFKSEERLKTLIRKWLYSKIVYF